MNINAKEQDLPCVSILEARWCLPQTFDQRLLRERIGLICGWGQPSCEPGTEQKLKVLQEPAMVPQAWNLSRRVIS